MTTLSAQVTLISYGSSWKYWANTQANYPAGWETVAFNDAAWPSGNGELGYGSLPAELLIADMNGQVLFRGYYHLVKGNNTLQINDTVNLQDGMYVLRMLAGGEVLTEKFSKIK